MSPKFYLVGPIVACNFLHWNRNFIYPWREGWLFYEHKFFLTHVMIIASIIRRWNKAGSQQASNGGKDFFVFSRPKCKKWVYYKCKMGKKTSEYILSKKDTLIEIKLHFESLITGFTGIYLSLMFTSFYYNAN